MDMNSAHIDPACLKTHIGKIEEKLGKASIKYTVTLQRLEQCIYRIWGQSVTIRSNCGVYPETVTP
jgi:hypothetical protein